MASVFDFFPEARADQLAVTMFSEMYSKDAAAHSVWYWRGLAAGLMIGTTGAQSLSFPAGDVEVATPEWDAWLFGNERGENMGRAMRNRNVDWIGRA